MSFTHASICYRFVGYAGYPTSIRPVQSFARVYKHRSPFVKSLEHLTSHYTIHDLKTPTSQKNGVVTSEKTLTQAA